MKKPDRLLALVGKSLAMQHVYKQIKRAAKSDVVVMLLGETGTGKELAAEAIHKLSKRREGPFITVNLGAIPRDLVASELFGHEKGAFTGAAKARRGRFEQAQDGTIFLDEIDSIDERVKISLLRLMEQRSFNRLGGEAKISANARIIVASNRNLEEMMLQGKFREDLFYRLDVFRVGLPPLNRRHGDIPLLAKEFLRQFTKKYSKGKIQLSSEYLRQLEAYSWPGNVRELKNVIQRSVLVCEGSQLLPKHLPSKFTKENASRTIVKFEIGTPLEEVEREMVLQALRVAGNNRTEAARLLGISRRSIYNRLKKYKLL